MKNTKNLFKPLLVAIAIIAPFSFHGYSQEANECTIEQPLNCDFKDKNFKFK